MFGRLRRPAPTETPEPGAHYRAWAEREKRIDEEISWVDRDITYAWRCGATDVVDKLLDKRNGIRPPRPAEVPVIPGRTS